MSKLLYFAVLLTLVGLLACGGEDATKAPVDTPAPQPTVAPASAAGPKATLEPTASPGLTTPLCRSCANGDSGAHGESRTHCRACANGDDGA